MSLLFLLPQGFQSLLAAFVVRMTALITLVIVVAAMTIIVFLVIVIVVDVNNNESLLLMSRVMLASVSLGRIHKGCPRLRGGRGLTAMWAKVDREGGGFAVCGHSFQCGLWNREEGI